MSDTIDFYKQRAEGHPEDAYAPGEGGQLIDLTEFHKETQQDKATIMVSGAEELRRGVLSKETAHCLSLAGVEHYDPFPSERNARAGNEGFFETLRNGFKTFIENIIKYIRMVFDWVANGIKTIFGFRKSSRITKEIDKELGNLKGEFSQTLQGLGFPAQNYNLEKFIGDLPPGVDRLPQMHLLKDKMTTDLEAVNGLSNATPLLQKAITQLKQASDKTVRASGNLKKVIAQEYTKTRVRASNSSLAVTAKGSTELVHLTKAMLEVREVMQTEQIAASVTALFKELYNKEFSNEELTAGFANTRKALQDSLEAHQVNLRVTNIGDILSSIQGLNTRYLEIADNEIDLRTINLKALGQVIDKDDMTKVSEIAGYYSAISADDPGAKQAMQELLSEYQQLTVDVRNFSQFCFNVSQSLLMTEKQIQGLITWYNRANTYYQSAVVNDMETILKTIKEARDAGHTPYADSNGVPTGMVVIPEADAKTFGERFAANTNALIEQDVHGLKTSINNFAKQTGWGKQL